MNTEHFLCRLGRENVTFCSVRSAEHKKSVSDCLRMSAVKSDYYSIVKPYPLRSAPATEKQINVLRRRKIEVPAGLTKGQASHLIGMLS